MKTISLVPVLVLVLICCLTVTADASPNWFVRGYAEGSIQPPHNEKDFGLRRPDLVATRGYGDNYSRYSLAGQVFAGVKINRGFLKEVFVVVKPDFEFGRTIPGKDYTWSPRLIGYVKNYGVGITLPRGWQIYMEGHSRWIFDDKVAAGDGPFGLYNAIVVRKSFDYEFK